MKYCCPPGEGCNDPSGTGRCALSLCRAVARADEDAARALERWGALQMAAHQHQGRRELRFRRRAFQRARDRALLRLAMKGKRRRRLRRAGGAAAGTSGRKFSGLAVG
jgi:hypothetical protein